jgi:glycosidase
MRSFRKYLAPFFLAATVSSLLAQADSVDVTFYYKPEKAPNVVYLPGEFNGWQLNRTTQMSLDPTTNVWFKTVRLRVGGPVNPQGIEGAYQYKFNENGTNWLSDPLNPRQNPLDFNNSVLFTRDPTIHYLLPNSVSGVVTDTRPEISAYIFPAVGASVDASTLRLFVDGVEYTNIGAFYDSTSKQLLFRLPDPLANGRHTLKLVAGSTTGRSAADSTEFILKGGFVQILNQSNPRYLRPTIRIDGLVEDPTITSGTLFHNDNPIPLTITNGEFSQTVNLVEGENVFRASVLDTTGTERESSPVTITYVVDHSPKPTISTTTAGPDLIFSATGNDPDGDPVTFQWRSEDDRNPIPLGVAASGQSVAVPRPAVPGRYHLLVEATDPDGNRDVARAYFELGEDGSLTFSSVNSNPSWVRDAVVYEIFLPAFTPEGTFAAATERLSWVKSLGANVIWLMPIYDNSETINEFNAGYNITDFFKVHPQLGTMADFEQFLEAAHDLGMRVILDTTPNHVSEQHPWAQDVRVFRDYSNFRPYLETRILGNDSGLGQFRKTIDSYTWYVHYSDWTLANLNYSNIETVTSMLEMYKWWVLEKRIDGYRMDVYWGPQNRYGSSAWWRPFREEIKRVQPDVFILGETAGTGVGTERSYAEGGSAADAAYDWNLFHQFTSVLNNGSIGDFDNRVRNFSPNLNYNHYTGPNSHYFRFLENHDETRIAAQVGVTKSKAGAAALLTIPGIPMIYAGQEVGETSRRGKINWNRPVAGALFAYYQRLVQIRNRFETFRSPRIKRVNSNASRVYPFCARLSIRTRLWRSTFQPAAPRPRWPSTRPTCN